MTDSKNTNYHDALIANMAQRAPKVAEAYDAHAQAKAAARAAEASVLQRAVDAVLPALPAMSGRIESRRTQLRKKAHGHTQDVGKAFVAFHPTEGLMIGRVVRDFRDLDSSRMFYVLVDGTFTEVIREPVSQVASGKTSWSGVADMVEVGYTQSARACTADDVILYVGLDTALQALHDALQKQEHRRLADTNSANKQAQAIMNATHLGEDDSK